MNVRDLIEQKNRETRQAKRRHVIKWGGATLHTTPEGLEQFTVAEWLRAKRVFFLHVPNEGKRDAREGLLLKLLGLEPGAADILIFDPPPSSRYKAPGVAIEMKSKTGRATDSQVAWLRKMESRGWIAKVCQGAGEAIDFLQSLGYGKAGVL